MRNKIWDLQCVLFSLGLNDMNTTSGRWVQIHILQTSKEGTVWSTQENFENEKSHSGCFPSLWENAAWAFLLDTL